MDKTVTDFLQNIARALGRSQVATSIEPRPVIDPQGVRFDHGDMALDEAFARHATEVGMQVHRCPQNAMVDQLLGLLADLGATRVTLACRHLPSADGLPTRLREAGITVSDGKDGQALGEHDQADAGITGCVAAIAETGSVVCSSEGNQGRRHSFVPPIHIVVVPASAILPDVLDLGLMLDAMEQLPASLLVITGPSKTADIEGVLITGVHGPHQVHLLLVDDI